MIIQMVASLSYGDAVGNDVLAIKQTIEEMGHQTDIYTTSIDKRLPEGTAKLMKDFPRLKKKDIAICHMACGSEINEIFVKLKCKKVMIYHNITPPEFFEGYSPENQKGCQEGYDQLKWMADKVDYCMADSAYNKSDLIRMGYQCKIDVLPIVMPFTDYDQEPGQSVFEKYQDGYTNILFVGRIVPNKKHEDIVRAFDAYQKNYNAKSRLIFVGSGAPQDPYRIQLEKYIETLGVKNVVFPGHIKFNEILAFYRLADVFLCQSEHEGFCVPLLEAMYLGTPIIAYKSTAVGETLGNGGILMDTKEPLITAGMIHQLVTDEELRATILENQKEQLKVFDNEVVKNQFATYLQENVL